MFRKIKRRLARLFNAKKPKKLDIQAAHDAAHNYWKNSSYTLLASDPTYYDRQEQVLRKKILP